MARKLLIHKGMKTKNKFIKLVFLSLLAILQTSCSKDSNSSSTANVAAVSYTMNNGYCYSNTGQQVATSYCSSTNNGYYLSNGYCYSSTTGQTVNNSYCSSTNGYYMSNGYCYSSSGQAVSTSYCNSTTTGYTWNNGYCYSTSTGQTVNNSYCSNSTGSSQQCVGYYYYYNNSGYTTVYCNGADCRGYTLLNQQGTQVSCQ